MHYLLICPKGCPTGRFFRVNHSGKTRVKTLVFLGPMTVNGVDYIGMPSIEPSEMSLMRGHNTELYGAFLSMLTGDTLAGEDLMDRWLSHARTLGIKGAITLVLVGVDGEVYVLTLSTFNSPVVKHIEGTALYQHGNLLPQDYLIQQIEEQHLARLAAIHKGMDGTDPAGLDLRLL